MSNQIHTLEFIKRQAKNIKREFSVTHTEALNICSKKNGYENWGHCRRALAGQNGNSNKALVKAVNLSFTDWLHKHKRRNSPLGDLATDMSLDNEWPLYDELDDYKKYLGYRRASSAAMAALIQAWKTYESYLRRLSLPKSEKSGKKPVIKKHDPRTISFVSNVKPLPYPERTFERFNVGDPAWISWNGRKAIPVTITEVDERHYTFRIERPLNKAGNSHYLFLDEVRSTPELACRNHVTL
jgi:hypothetical protein